MKALDFLSGTPRLRTVVCLWGGSYVFQKLATDKILEVWSEIEDVEKVQTEEMSVLIGSLEEGSVFGRVLVVDYGGGWKHTEGLNQALLGLDLDKVIIRCPKVPPALALTPVDCSQISRKPSRRKFLGIRKDHYELEFSDEAVESLLTRTIGAESVESALQCLSFIVSEREVTSQDVSDVVPSLEPRSYLMRAVLTGNPMMFARELQKGKPVSTLYALHACYFRLFTFVEAVNSGAGEEIKAQDLLKITPREVRDWKTAATKYRTTTLRKLMELTQRMLSQVMAGTGDGWKERLMLEAKLLLEGHQK